VHVPLSLTGYLPEVKSMAENRTEELYWATFCLFVYR
jgi:hypothetical protein